MRHPSNVAEEFSAELVIAAASSGATQREIGRRAGVSQPLVSRVIRRLVIPDLALAEKLAHATGHRLVVKLLPGDGLRLRDTGQLGLADVIRTQAHPRWKLALEVPVAKPPDRRAADLVLEQRGLAIHIEIERWLVDFQAQLRRAQLKRAALTDRLDRPVRLVLALAETRSSRAAVREHADIVRMALPASPRQVWIAIRAGEPLAQDGLIYVKRSGRAGR